MQVIREKLGTYSHSERIPCFKEPCGSFPCSKNRAIESYLEPINFILHFHTALLQVSF